MTFTGWMLLNGFSSEATTVYQCLHGMAPAYLAELCLPINASASRRGGLRSATTSNLVIPRCSSVQKNPGGFFGVLGFNWFFFGRAVPNDVKYTWTGKMTNRRLIVNF